MQRILFKSSRFVNRNVRRMSSKCEKPVFSAPNLNLSDLPAFKNVLTPELKSLISCFQRHNHEIRIAGGAVRDLISGKEDINDVDLATTATPQEMIDMFSQEQIRMINELGVKHGTVTARIGIQDKATNFEVTTLRIDGPTEDGRRPKEVEFTKNWYLDAERRDLTINSMFLGFDGTVYDFFNGKEDIEAKKVVFVGDADTRIKEDYLRILRYFRFYGRVADKPDNHAPETLEAIRSNVAGMKHISGERIWVELKKILAGRFVESLLMTMQEVGLSDQIGLPKSINFDEMKRVLLRAKSNNVELAPATILASGLATEDDVMTAHGRLKMSGLERDSALFVVTKRQIENISLKQCKCWWVDAKSKSTTNVKKMIEEVIKYRGEIQLLKHFEGCEFPKSPIGGQDLKEAGCPPGPSIGIVLNALKDKWKESDFQMTKSDMLGILPEVLDKAIAQGGGDRRAKKRKK